MKMSPITNIQVTVFSGQYSLSWIAEGMRYHVWLDRQSRRNHDQTIYKNPPAGVEYRGPGYFRTRQLDATKNANATALTYVLNYATTNRLFELADEAEARVKATERAENLERWRVTRQKDAGPALYAACKRVLDSPFEPDKWRLNVQEAIAEAEKA